MVLRDELAARRGTFGKPRKLDFPSPCSGLVSTRSGGASAQAHADSTRRGGGCLRAGIDEVGATPGGSMRRTAGRSAEREIT